MPVTAGTPYDQAPHRVRLAHGPREAAELVGHAAGPVVAVVLDVLSFSTTVSVAADRGVAVVPCPWGDSRAAELARAHGAALAVHRAAGRGDPDAVTLSPGSVRRATGLSRLVLPSPNGSALSAALAGSGATVLAGCLRNAGAVAAHLAGCLTRARPATVVLAAAGERWDDGTLRVALEDALGAGAVADALLDPLLASGIRAADLSPEATAAVAGHRDAAADLRRVLRGSASGSELRAAGFAEDVDIAAEADASAVVPVLRDGMFAAPGAPPAT